MRNSFVSGRFKDGSVLEIQEIDNAIMMLQFILIECDYVLDENHPVPDTPRVNGFVKIT